MPPTVEFNIATQADHVRVRHFITQLQMYVAMTAKVPGDFSLMATAMAYMAGQIAGSMVAQPSLGVIIENLQQWILTAASQTSPVDAVSSSVDPDGGVPYIPTPPSDEPEEG